MSLERKTKSKWFKIANILLAIAIICLANIDTIIKTFGGDFNDTYEIIVLDNTGYSSNIFKIKTVCYCSINYNISYH